MKALVIEDAPVLIPHAGHQNFTRTRDFIPKNTPVEGTIKIVKGLKRDKPFEYNLFFTSDNKIIFIKYIKPMQKTEVTLGADSTVSATKVDLPSTSNFGLYPLGGALVGLGLGWHFTKGKSHHVKVIAIVVGGLTGFSIGKYIQSKRSVHIAPSK